MCLITLIFQNCTHSKVLSLLTSLGHINQVAVRTGMLQCYPSAPLVYIAVSSPFLSQKNLTESKEDKSDPNFLYFCLNSLQENSHKIHGFLPLTCPAPRSDRPSWRQFFVQVYILKMILSDCTFFSMLNMAIIEYQEEKSHCK